MSNVMQPATVLVPAPRRHALGLPAGSVRALLALAVLGLLWTVALTHWHGETVSEADKHLPTILIALQILMVLILVHFFTAHGHTIGRHISIASPLGLPGGSIVAHAKGNPGNSFQKFYAEGDGRTGCAAGAVSLFSAQRTSVAGRHYHRFRYFTDAIDQWSI